MGLGPDILTSGLRVVLDSSNHKSYDSGSAPTVVKNLYTRELYNLNNGISYTGKAWDFDGTDDYVELDTIIPIIDTDTTGTISCWVKFDDVATTQNVFSATSTASNRRLYLYINSLGQIVGNMQGAGTNQWTVTTTDAVLPNTWYHIVLRQGADILINGVEVAQTLTNAPYPTRWFNDFTNQWNNFEIGRRAASFQTSAGVCLNGSINQFLYQSITLNNAQVLDLFNETKHRFGIK